VIAQLRPSLLNRLSALRADAVTAFSYGPSVRDFIDHHGDIIRTAGSIANIVDNVNNCTCHSEFAAFVDPAVGHVRTQDPALLPSPLREMVAKGLNFRPRIKSTPKEALDSALNWAKQVCNKLIPKRGAYVNRTANIVHMFYYRLRKHTSARQWSKANSGYDAALLKAQGRKAASRLACTSTDKAANTASFECLHWYRAVCMSRLISPAFAECTGQNEYERLAATAEQWTPWADISASKAAILFCTPKMHKRLVDPLAYRFITNACAAVSKPVSLEVTRVLTILSGLVRQHCTDLGDSMGAKLWWLIDSLDSVPLNLNRDPRPDRHLAAFDVEKCYECVPLFEGEHSLLSHLEFFLDLAFQQNEFIGSNLDWLGVPKANGHWCSHATSADVTYSRSGVLNLVSDLLHMTNVTVGTESRQQEVGLPMGFSSSGILLNLYLFVPEYKFVLRLAELRPDLLHITHELFRYIDDLGCFGNCDMRLFLDEQQEQSEGNPFWIYPIAPNGPLTIKDQTLRSDGVTTAVYLDTLYSLHQGQLSFEMYCKGDAMPFQLLRFTHWDSNISRACKIGMIYAQTRTACRSASDVAKRSKNLSKIRAIFLSICYPTSVVDSSISKALSVYSSRFPALTTLLDGVA
jgi:hypothetical protein